MANVLPGFELMRPFVECDSGYIKSIKMTWLARLEGEELITIKDGDNSLSTPGTDAVFVVAYRVADVRIKRGHFLTLATDLGKWCAVDWHNDLTQRKQRLFLRMASPDCQMTTIDLKKIKRRLAKDL